SLDGGKGNDTLAGGAGDDSYVFTSLLAPNGAETDQIVEAAMAGADTLDFSALGATEPATANLANDNGMASHGVRMINAAAGNAANIENVLGGAGNDNLSGNAGANTLEGLGGNDTLAGALGSDTFRYSGAAIKGSDRIVEAGPCLDLDVIQFVNAAAVVIDIGTVALQNNVIAGGLLSLT